MRAGKRTPVNVPAARARGGGNEGEHKAARALRLRRACPAMDQASPPLADGWIEATAPDGSAYFINTSTQETRWQRPEPAPPPPPPPPLPPPPRLPSSWQALKAPDGRTYYGNSITGETSWEPPQPQLQPPPPPPPLPPQPPPLPLPPQPPQVIGALPGFAPLPSQGSQCCSEGTRISAVEPRTASSSATSNV